MLQEMEIGYFGTIKGRKEFIKSYIDQKDNYVHKY